ncbi:MAG: hypothetical protein Q9204_007900 [Flavoplaca sp. TL-2023a]
MAITDPEPNYSQQSQSSSNDSIISRLSDRNAIVKNGVRPISRDGCARELTPSTSLSDASSQEPSGSMCSPHQGVINQSPTAVAKLGSNSPQPLDNQPSCPTSMQSNNNLQNAIQPPKRTASGEVKRPGQSLQSSPHATSEYSHSRNTSTTSRSSHISDISNDLCARLSYAVFKVQNGFQSHSLPQIEAMALQKATSPTGTPQRQSAIHSPTSPFRSTNPTYSPGKRDSTQRSPTNRLRLAQKPQQPPTSPNSPRLQNSSQANAPRPSYPTTTSQPYTSPNHAPTLAPPADIQPRRRQPRPTSRPKPTQTTPPTLHTPNTTNTNSTTPPKTTKEQDAVETLIFMSSPNASYYPSSSHRAYDNTSPRHINLSAMRLSSNADIDRVLDQMPNDYSSSDEDGDGGFV